jgi:preprotein translocase subunit SecG
MDQIILIVHVLLALSLIGLVLIQHGKGADMGAAFGSGASATVFGSSGSGSFLTRATAVIAALFFATSLTLAFLSGQKPEQDSVMDQMPAAAEETSGIPDELIAPELPADIPAGIPAIDMDLLE